MQRHAPQQSPLGIPKAGAAIGDFGPRRPPPWHQCKNICLWIYINQHKSPSKLWRRCGTCAAVCPTGALQSPLFSDEEWSGVREGLSASNLPERTLVLSCPAANLDSLPRGATAELLPCVGLLGGHPYGPSGGLLARASCHQLPLATYMRESCFRAPCQVRPGSCTEKPIQSEWHAALCRRCDTRRRTPCPACAA